MGSSEVIAAIMRTSWLEDLKFFHEERHEERHEEIVWNNFKHKIFRSVLISMQYNQCVIITRHFWRDQKKKKKSAHKNKILINHISFGTQKYILKKTKIYLELQRYIDMLQLFGVVVWHQRKNNKDYLLLFRTK